ncbi:MAG: restriction endonuclease subunit S, partial [Desulfobacterales bacterium]|nr:restriction endonuclease subunit S [Desulfobacterales bacterium]
TPKDAHQYAYVFETEKTITESGLLKCNSKLFPKNTIFITARGTVGKLNLARGPMAMNQTSYALRGKDNVSQLFLFCAVKDAIKHIRQRAVGSVFDAIIIDTFKLIPFILPKVEKIQQFEKMVEPLFYMEENLLVQNQKLKQARDLLLPKLMNGEIAV